MRPVTFLPLLVALLIPAMPRFADDFQQKEDPVLSCQAENGCFQSNHLQVDLGGNDPAVRARAAGKFGPALVAQVTDSANSSDALAAFTGGPGSAGLFATAGGGDPAIVVRGSAGRDLLVARMSNGEPRLRLRSDGRLELPGDLHARGHVFLHAFEGKGSSGTAFLQARDGERSSIGLRLRTQSGGKMVNALHITPGGSVGIGTTKPGNFDLAVEGKIGAREIRVTVDAWADDVFDADYPLSELSEVAEFIDAHGHLPDVPAAATVEGEGLELGAFQAVLLRKIEELTLHTIRQQAALDRQAALIDALRGDELRPAGNMGTVP